MRLVFLLLCCSGPVTAQGFSLGIKGGVPLTSTSDTGREVGRYGGQTSFYMKRYSVGPSVEVGLPLGLRFEADAQYMHARQDRFAGPAPSGTLLQQATRVDIWDIPLLLKFQRRTPGLQPFATAGSTVRRISDLDIDLITIPTFPGFTGTRQQLTLSSGEPIRYGVTLGGGLSWKLRVIRIEPELRYTHWTARRWTATTEQIEMLLGVRFPVGR